ncbi:[FeFe] hydrogenase H-cluster radical SAM maturase HydE [Thermosediminibacter oceani]|uniref:Radical SAM domain protein n=1 Tax=Thermosediminibacter oceani (strain ATCC BAA-1034 / DSM 16646 / JW/IW-1228P) TaxID=555079 RepID=D9S1A2_THEOJ|nr:[FeFe] hydrogenase H-cluster radical SAM maturase HydE [Thermosediminibacter oceani]ADL08981.1 Radical SAM domain protein [Thermosediminibacter oceani DSM 16646]
MSEHIIVCSTTSHMLKGEKVLRTAGIPVRLIPTPKKYGRLCTTAIVIPSEMKQEAEAILSSEKVQYTGIYEFEPFKVENLLPEDGRVGEDFAGLIKKIEAGQDLSLKEIERLLASENPLEVEALLAAGDKMRQKTVGDVVDIRGGIEFSNYCRKNCNYCGLRRANTSLLRYRMTPEEIIKAAVEMRKLGLSTVILQSGEDPWYTEEKMVEILRGIKSETGMRITMSIGERPRHELEAFRKAGANNYLLRIESANREVFKLAHPDDDYDVRVKNIRDLKELGYVTGSGCIVGLPGQRPEHLAEDIVFLRDMGINMVGLGPFLPARNTPFENLPPGDLLMSLKMVAVARLVLKHVFIPSTTAMATLSPDGLKRGLLSGANVIMVNFTPTAFRKSYEIYSNKAVVTLQWAVDLVKSLGRKLPPYIKETA